MKIIKRITLIALTMILSISLTGQAEAKVSKTVKPEVRVVNGTIIVTDKTNITKYTENGLTEYNFYYKKNGKWKIHHSEYHVTYAPKTVYAEALKDGDYAVSVKNEFKGWSDKVAFKVKNTGKNLTDETIYYTGYTAEDGLYEIYVDSEKKLGVYAISFTELQAKSITIKAHYVDKKGKLHYMGKKKMKKDSYGSYSASFTPVKGQKHYAISQVNEKGKVLGYLHISLATGKLGLANQHHGLPSKKMNYKKSDWAVY